MNFGELALAVLDSLEDFVNQRKMLRKSSMIFSKNLVIRYGAISAKIDTNAT